MEALEARIKCQAHALGFELAGIASAAPADGFDRMQDWLANGYAGEMAYMHRQSDARREPSSILVDVQSVVMVGMNYYIRPSPAEVRDNADQRRSPVGRVSRYSWGSRDYHDVLRERLSQLLAWVRGEAPRCTGRAVVDTAPLLERDFARRAGLGWFGKNTMLLDKRLGSYFFLGALLLDLKLQPDSPHEAHHCGTCTACLDACPTHAFVEPGLMDARRCISYLTIELRGSIPIELRASMGDWVFGCDICQEVCPWNRKAPGTQEPVFHPRADLEPIDLVELLGLSKSEFRRRFRGTAITRTKRQGLLRNAAIALGNRRDRSALSVLAKRLSDSDPIIREAAEWAIGQIQGPARA